MTILRSTRHGMRLAATMALLCAPLVSVAQDAAPPAGAAVTGPPPGVSEARAVIEGAMAELGRLANAADGAEDVVQGACLLDKQERGAEVMELVTTELLVIEDAGATAQQRAFAAEKLGALADRMSGLLTQARGCDGDATPEDQDDKTRTELDERPTVPLPDPTVGGARPPVPPPVDDGRPPTVESPTK